MTLSHSAIQKNIFSTLLWEGTHPHENEMTRKLARENEVHILTSDFWFNEIRRKHKHKQSHPNHSNC